MSLLLSLSPFFLTQLTLCLKELRRKKYRALFSILRRIGNVGMTASITHTLLEVFCRIRGKRKF